MAKKLYFNKGASTAGVTTLQGSTGGMTILLLFIPVIAFIIYSKSKGGKPAGELTDEEKKAKRAAQQAEKDRKKAEEEEKNKKKKPERSNIKHSDPRGEALVDEKWEAVKAANPNNPFYQPLGPPPEGWMEDGQARPPIYKKTTEEERANVKGVHKPYANGRILPYETRTDNRIDFITKEGEEPVNGLAKVNPYTIVPGVRPVSEYVHRTPASAYNNPSPEGRGTGVKHGSKVLSNLPTAEKKARFIEFTKSFSEAPVSMPAEDINVLLAAVEVATANPDPNSQAFKIVMQECWHNKQGTYPIFVTTPLSIIEKNIKEAWPEFFERLDLYWEASKKTRQKEPRFKQILTDHMGFKSKAEVQEPKVLILSWFLEHFRLWDRKYRIFVCDDGSDFENPPTEKLKVAYRLMTWVEILAHACAQSWILSPRGFDLPGLVVRYHNQPLPRPFVGGNRTFDQAAAIFLPSYSELERTPLESWYQRAVRTMNGDKKGGGYNAVASVAQTTSIEYNHMCGVNVPNPFRSLTFRPGWSVGAVLKTGDLDTAFHPDSEPSGGYVDDGRMFIHEWEKGVEARPGSDGLHSLFSDFYLHIQPEIVRFRKRAQYSWSPTLTQQSAGFVTGQIAMCLGSLSTELAKSRNVHRDFWESDNHVNRPTFPKYLDFGDNIPLEYELKDGVKTYSFPSLREFCALQRIYIPYVSLVPNAADRTPEQSPECTATLALHDSLGLYKQLDEKRGKVILVVICKDGKDPVKGIHHTAEEWCGRLQLELKLEAEKLNRRYEDYRELIKWHKDGYDPNRVEPMNLVQGDASMWHV